MGGSEDFARQQMLSRVLKSMVGRLEQVRRASQSPRL